MNFVKAVKVGPKNSNPVVQITWGGADNSQVGYSFVRGAVTWPGDGVPGILIVAGKEADSRCVEIFKEYEVSGLKDCRDAFIDFAKYMPSLYYFEDIPEHQGFLRHLSKHRKLSGKLPLYPVPNPESEDFGNGLIQDYLSKNHLLVPPNGPISKQLQEARPESGPEEHYAVKALRFLLQGIDDRPWPFETIDLNFNNCAR